MSNRVGRRNLSLRCPGRDPWGACLVCIVSSPVQIGQSCETHTSSITGIASILTLLKTLRLDSR